MLEYVNYSACWRNIFFIFFKKFKKKLDTNICSMYNSLTKSEHMFAFELEIFSINIKLEKPCIKTEKALRYIVEML